MLVFRLLRQTLFPPRPTGPRNWKRLSLLCLLVPLFLFIQGVHWIGFLLDDLLFRGYRKVQIREPLFIVGLPRSGTTFLQRVFAKDTERFTTLRLWELLLAPSVTERKFWLGVGALNRALGSPFSRLGRWGEKRGLGWLDVIHEVSLDDPEEDYFLLLPVFACFLLVVPFPYHDAIWKLARFDEMPERERAPIMGFYKASLQRHLYVFGPEKQLLSKNPSFTPFIQSLKKTFPDGRILCCVRDPMEVVPSLLSSVGTGAGVFGYDVAEPRIRDRFVDMLVFFAGHSVTSLNQLPESHRAFVPLKEIKGDVEGFVLELYRRFGWEAGPGFCKRLKEDAQRSKGYKSRHSYSLEEYDLTPDEIRIRFSAFNSRFVFWDPGSDPEANPHPKGPDQK